jgi:flagellar protein FlaG
MDNGSNLTIQRTDPHPNDVVTPTTKPDANQISERRELIKAVKALNQTELFGENNELTFIVDRNTHRPLVRIVDRKTREVIRQIPSESALRMAEDLAKVTA